MTEQYATDTSEENVEEEEILDNKPLKVEITNQPTEKQEKNPTSQDTEFIENYIPTEEEIKEMTDAQ